MNRNKAFDKRIEKFLAEQPNSSASHVIREISKNYPNSQSHYFNIESFCDRIGMTFNSIPHFGSRRNEALGYIPSIHYYSNNKLNETAGTVNLIDESVPMRFEACQMFLAKEIVYRLMKLENLEQLVKNSF